ncbi:MAG TPA: oxygen-independent coproporphyrinogen III oxidase [Phenylobacterium sp.]
MTTLTATRPTQQLIAKYDGRAPRYTSYPTAVQFTPEIDAGCYRTWLAELPTVEAVSLYVHVPFCSRLCWYCGCNTRAVNRREPIREYVQYLLREVAMLQAALPSALQASAIHLGGGTPNMLSTDEMEAIFGALGGAFRIEVGAEIAAELDPASLTREWVLAAGRLGLNRASLGVQTLDAKVQAAVNRHESVEQIAACVAALREIQVRSLNLDLMYGLPHQTRANVLDTVEKVLTFRPERLALFGYAHVPWMKSHQKLLDEGALPGPAERLDQSESAAERLVAEGYVQIGIDHFALPTDELAIAFANRRLRRNFQGYTTDEARTLLGVGVSAIGSLPQGYVQNIAQEVGWRAAIDGEELPIARGVRKTEEDRFRGEIIERLMCDFAVDLAAACRRHGRSMAELDAALVRLEPFIDDQLVRLEGGRLVITDAGRILVRSVSACFDAYFEPQAVRHSKAL